MRLHHSGKWEWLSIGEELRRVIANRRAVPGISGDQIVKIKNTMNKGDLVNDEAVMALIADSFNRSRKKYFVIDGFPRNLQQVELFRDYVCSFITYLNILKTIEIETVLVYDLISVPLALCPTPLHTRRLF